MDEVLKLALAHENPDDFLVEPSETVDWRSAIQTIAATEGAKGAKNTPAHH